MCALVVVCILSSLFPPPVAARVGTSSAATASNPTGNLACTPVTCVGAGFICGQPSDGCGNVLSCGDCSGHGSCSNNTSCHCNGGYDGSTCGACAADYTGYPTCHPDTGAVASNVATTGAAAASAVGGGGASAGAATMATSQPGTPPISGTRHRTCTAAACATPRTSTMPAKVVDCPSAMACKVTEDGLAIEFDGPVTGLVDPSDVCAIVHGAAMSSASPLVCVLQSDRLLLVAYANAGGAPVSPGDDVWFALRECDHTTCTAIAAEGSAPTPVIQGPDTVHPCAATFSGAASGGSLGREFAAVEWALLSSSGDVLWTFDRKANLSAVRFPTAPLLRVPPGVSVRVRLCLRSWANLTACAQRTIAVAANVPALAFRGPAEVHLTAGEALSLAVDITGIPDGCTATGTGNASDVSFRWKLWRSPSNFTVIGRTRAVYFPPRSPFLVPGHNFTVEAVAFRTATPGAVASVVCRVTVGHRALVARINGSTGAELPAGPAFVLDGRYGSHDPDAAAATTAARAATLRWRWTVEPASAAAQVVGAANASTLVLAGLAPGRYGFKLEVRDSADPARAPGIATVAVAVATECANSSGSRSSGYNSAADDDAVADACAVVEVGMHLRPGGFSLVPHGLPRGHAHFCWRLVPSPPAALGADALRARELVIRDGVLPPATLYRVVFAAARNASLLAGCANVSARMAVRAPGVRIASFSFITAPREALGECGAVLPGGSSVPFVVAGTVGTTTAVELAPGKKIRWGFAYGLPRVSVRLGFDAAGGGAHRQQRFAFEPAPAALTAEAALPKGNWTLWAEAVHSCFGDARIGARSELAGLLCIDAYTRYELNVSVSVSAAAGALTLAEIEAALVAELTADDGNEDIAAARIPALLALAEEGGLTAGQIVHLRARLVNILLGIFRNSTRLGRFRAFVNGILPLLGGGAAGDRGVDLAALADALGTDSVAQLLAHAERFTLAFERGTEPGAWDVSVIWPDALRVVARLVELLHACACLPAATLRDFSETVQRLVLRTAANMTAASIDGVFGVAGDAGGDPIIVAKRADVRSLLPNASWSPPPGDGFPAGLEVPAMLADENFELAVAVFRFAANMHAAGDAGAAAVELAADILGVEVTGWIKGDVLPAGTEFRVPVTLSRNTSRADVQCVFFDVDTLSWSTGGCVACASQPANDTGVLLCCCNHLTEFSAERFGEVVADNRASSSSGGNDAAIMVMILLSGGGICALLLVAAVVAAIIVRARKSRAFRRVAPSHVQLVSVEPEA